MTTARSAVTWPAMLLAAAVSATGCATEGSSTAKQHEALPRAPTAGQELFADGFDSDANGWALPETAVGRMNFDDGDFVWESKVPNLRPHVIAETLGKQYDAGTLEMRDVVVIANVTIARGKAAAGVFCREVPDSDSEFQWYEFVVRDGFAAIRRSDSGGHIEVLARTDDAQLPIGKKAMITGICRDDAQGRGDLWLSLNGNTLLHYRDAKPLANGAPGIVAYDSPGKAAGDRFLIRWHDFAVHKAQDP